MVGVDVVVGVMVGVLIGVLVVLGVDHDEDDENNKQ